MRTSGILTATLVFLATSARAGSLLPPGTVGTLTPFLGQKSLDSGDWHPVNDQIELGVESTFGKRAWPALAAIDVLHSSDSARGVNATTTELCGGARKRFSYGAWHPYVGGGLVLGYATAHVNTGFGSESDSDTGLGLWLGGGAVYSFGRYGVGGALRWSTWHVSSHGLDADAGGLHFGLIAGMSL